MGVRALSSTSVGVPVGGVWALVVSVTDSCGAPVAEVPTVAVTLPDDGSSAPAAVEVATGIYRAELVTTVAGRYVARVTTTTYGVAEFMALVTAVVTGAEMPDLVALRGDPDTDPRTFGYLGENSWTDADIQDALDAETVAQFRACNVPAAYPDDLREALLRRVLRNLAMRGQPFMTVPDSDVPTLIPALDAEVRRFEAFYRRLVMG